MTKDTKDTLAAVTFFGFLIAGVIAAPFWMKCLLSAAAIWDVSGLGRKP